MPASVMRRQDDAVLGRSNNSVRVHMQSPTPRRASLLMEEAWTRVVQGQGWLWTRWVQSPPNPQYIIQLNRGTRRFAIARYRSRQHLYICRHLACCISPSEERSRPRPLSGFDLTSSRNPNRRHSLALGTVYELFRQLRPLLNEQQPPGSELEQPHLTPSRHHEPLPSA